MRCDQKGVVVLRTSPLDVAHMTIALTQLKYKYKSCNRGGKVGEVSSTDNLFYPAMPCLLSTFQNVFISK